MSEDYVPTFLELAFDWFVLENWQGPINGEHRAQEHLRLAAEWAKLGFKGRRPYAIKTSHWGNPDCYRGPRETIELLRPVTSVPQDLLPQYERHMNVRRLNAILVRTDFGAGTAERFQQLVDGLSDAVDATLGDNESIVDDERYYTLKDNLLPALYSYFPYLVDAVGDPDYEEPEESVPWESPDLQRSLYLTGFDNVDTDDQRVSGNSVSFFVADFEAMRTGMLLWLRVDEFGDPVIRERIQPASVRLAVHSLHNKSVSAWRAEVPYMLEDVPDYEFVAPWVPPADD